MTVILQIVYIYIYYLGFIVLDVSESQDNSSVRLWYTTTGVPSLLCFVSDVWAIGFWHDVHQRKKIQ